MIKILIRNDLVFGGGVENVLADVANYLSDNGYDITLSCDRIDKIQFNQKYSPKIRCTKGNLISFKRKHSRFIIHCLMVVNIIYRFFYRQWANKRFDLVIAFKEGPCMAEIAKIKAPHKIAWVHTDYASLHWTGYCFHSNENELKCMKKFDSIVCVSEACKEGLVSTLGNPGNLCVINNPINCADIYSKSLDKNANHPVKNRFRFVSVGRLVDTKNYGLIIDVCKQLELSYDFEMLIIGDGINYQFYKDRIEKERIRSIKLLGWMDNPYPIVRESDCFVSASISESYGLAIQESIILGVPVIAVNYPALSEVMKNNTGIIVQNDAIELYKAMELMLQSRDGNRPNNDGCCISYYQNDLYISRLERIKDLINNIVSRIENNYIKG